MFRWRYLALSVTLLVIAFLLFRFQYPLLKTIVTNAVPLMVSRRVNPDNFPGKYLHDGQLHVFLCGTGTPMSVNRAGACTLILVNGVALLFDVGMWWI